MATRKDTAGATASYRILRDCAVGAAGETVRLTEADAALLIRDGMVAPAEES